MEETLLYEGKTKKLFHADEINQIIIYYKDNDSISDEFKQESTPGKGIINNKVCALLYQFLESSGIATHFISQESDREQLCHKVDIIPIQVIIRNLIAGSMAKRLAIEDGTRPLNLIYELCYKNSELGNPLINEHHAVALRLSSYNELSDIERVVRRVNGLLTQVFDNMGLVLVSYKLEFGKDKDGSILLADEISLDTCRLWDKYSGQEVDKTQFKKDLNGIQVACQKMLERVQSSL